MGVSGDPKLRRSLDMGENLSGRTIRYTHLDTVFHGNHIDEATEIYPTASGQGVDIYVIDSGVNKTQVNFGDRVILFGDDWETGSTKSVDGLGSERDIQKSWYDYWRDPKIAFDFYKNEGWDLKESDIAHYLDGDSPRNTDGMYIGPESDRTHGTGVALTAAGEGVGIAPDAKIYSLCHKPFSRFPDVERSDRGYDVRSWVYNNSYRCFLTIMQHHEWKIRSGNFRPSVVNCSWGYPRTSDEGAWMDDEKYWPFEQDIVDLAYLRVKNTEGGHIWDSIKSSGSDDLIYPGIHFTVANGNEDLDKMAMTQPKTEEIKESPLIQVGGSYVKQNSDILPGEVTTGGSFSELTYTVGDVDIIGPSGGYYLIPNIWSFGENYVNSEPMRDMWFNGTSGASPMVAGVLACILERNPLASPKDAKQFLKQTARKAQFSKPVVLKIKGVNPISYNWYFSELHNNIDIELNITLKDSDTTVEMLMPDGAYSATKAQEFIEHPKNSRFYTRISLNDPTRFRVKTADKISRLNLKARVKSVNSTYGVESIVTMPMGPVFKVALVDQLLKDYGLGKREEVTGFVRLPESVNIDHWKEVYIVASEYNFSNNNPEVNTYKQESYLSHPVGTRHYPIELHKVVEGEESTTAYYVEFDKSVQIWHKRDSEFEHKGITKVFNVEFDLAYDFHYTEHIFDIPKPKDDAVAALSELFTDAFPWSKFNLQEYAGGLKETADSVTWNWFPGKFDNNVTTMFLEAMNKINGFTGEYTYMDDAKMDEIYQECYMHGYKFGEVSKDIGGDEVWLYCYSTSTASYADELVRNTQSDYKAADWSNFSSDKPNRSQMEEFFEKGIDEQLRLTSEDYQEAINEIQGTSDARTSLLLDYKQIVSTNRRVSNRQNLTGGLQRRPYYYDVSSAIESKTGYGLLFNPCQQYCIDDFEMESDETFVAFYLPLPTTCGGDRMSPFEHRHHIRAIKDESRPADMLSLDTVTGKVSLDLTSHPEWNGQSKDFTFEFDCELLQDSLVAGNTKFDIGDDFNTRLPFDVTVKYVLDKMPLLESSDTLDVSKLFDLSPSEKRLALPSVTREAKADGWEINSIRINYNSNRMILTTDDKLPFPLFFGSRVVTHITGGVYLDYYDDDLGKDVICVDVHNPISIKLMKSFPGEGIGVPSSAEIENVSTSSYAHHFKPDVFIDDDGMIRIGNRLDEISWAPGWKVVLDLKINLSHRRQLIDPSYGMSNPTDSVDETTVDYWKVRIVFRSTLFMEQVLLDRLIENPPETTENPAGTVPESWRDYRHHRDLLFGTGKAALNREHILSKLTEDSLLYNQEDSPFSVKDDSWNNRWQSNDIEFCKYIKSTKDWGFYLTDTNDHLVGLTEYERGFLWFVRKYWSSDATKEEFISFPFLSGLDRLNNLNVGLRHTCGDKLIGRVFSVHVEETNPFAANVLRFFTNDKQMFWSYSVDKKTPTADASSVGDLGREFTYRAFPGICFTDVYPQRSGQNDRDRYYYNTTYGNIYLQFGSMSEPFGPTSSLSTREKYSHFDVIMKNFGALSPRHFYPRKFSSTSDDVYRNEIVVMPKFREYVPNNGWVRDKEGDYSDPGLLWMKHYSKLRSSGQGWNINRHDAAFEGGDNPYPVDLGTVGIVSPHMTNSASYDFGASTLNDYDRKFVRNAPPLMYVPDRRKLFGESSNSIGFLPDFFKYRVRWTHLGKYRTPTTNKSPYGSVPFGGWITMPIYNEELDAWVFLLHIRTMVSGISSPGVKRRVYDTPLQKDHKGQYKYHVEETDFRASFPVQNQDGSWRTNMILDERQRWVPIAIRFSQSPDHPVVERVPNEKSVPKPNSIDYHKVPRHNGVSGFLGEGDFTGDELGSREDNSSILHNDVYRSLLNWKLKDRRTGTIPTIVDKDFTNHTDIPFIFKYEASWQTNGYLILPFVEGGTYDCVVDWGDGTKSHIDKWNHKDTAHRYPTPTGQSIWPNVSGPNSTKIYTVKITGIMTRWNMKPRLMSSPWYTKVTVEGTKYTRDRSSGNPHDSGTKEYETWETEHPSGRNNPGEFYSPYPGTPEWDIYWEDRENPEYPGDSRTSEVTRRCSRSRVESVKYGFLEVLQWGNIKYEEDGYFYAWYECNNLVFSATDHPDLSRCTDMHSAFKYCYGLDSIPSLDLRNCEQFLYCFYGSRNLPYDALDGVLIDCSKARNIEKCTKNTDINPDWHKCHGLNTKPSDRSRGQGIDPYVSRNRNPAHTIPYPIGKLMHLFSKNVEIGSSSVKWLGSSLSDLIKSTPEEDEESLVPWYMPKKYTHELGASIKVDVYRNELKDDSLDRGMQFVMSRHDESGFLHERTYYVPTISLHTNFNDFDFELFWFLDGDYSLYKWILEHNQIISISSFTDYWGEEV